MQARFDFGDVEDVRWARERLRLFFGELGPVVVRTPVGQLIKSMLGSRTRDAVSLAAYHQLIEVYQKWPVLALAQPDDIEAIIAEVTFPDVKARHIGEALRLIEGDHPDFDLAFLARLGVPDALVWLERLPGVGRKVSASTLNFSTLNMPAFVIDTHILRILRRFGFVRSKADTGTAYDTVMAAAHGWTADELVELHCLMKRLGQTICRFDQPNCSGCPIRERCQAVDVFDAAA